MISFPESSLLARTIPTAPTKAACCPLSTLALSPRRQTKIFPFTLLGSSVPALQSTLQEHENTKYGGHISYRTDLEHILKS